MKNLKTDKTPLWFLNEKLGKKILRKQNVKKKKKVKSFYIPPNHTHQPESTLNCIIL